MGAVGEKVSCFMGHVDLDDDHNDDDAKQDDDTNLEDMGAVGEKVSDDRQAWVPFLCARVVLQMRRILTMMLMMAKIMTSRTQNSEL